MKYVPVTLLPLLLLLFACEGFLEGNGTVYAEQSGQPLDSVWVQAFVKRVNPDNLHTELYTDTTGTFFVSTGMVGCTPRCPDLLIRLSKPGYVSQTLTNPVDAVVYLKKE